jgi:signal transduction histidine kinase
MSIQVELWDTNQANLLVLPEGPVAANDLRTEFAQCSAAQSRVVGKLRSIKNQITYPAVAAVSDSDGKTIGYFVRWRRISPTANGRKQLADLLGNNAELYFGNVDGDFWTDLESVILGPQPNQQGSLEISHYDRNGHSVMGLGRPIKGTPWLVVLEFPDQVFLSPAKAFLRRMVFFGVILLTIGVLVALLLSRSITRPLHALTEAAAGISDGDYSRFVQINTRDELGVLARAFNLMTARVRDSQRELESEVHQRTAQLKAANKELEAFSYSVSHDLRAPLRHINGFSQSLLEDYEDQLDDVGKGFLRELRSASKEMAQLIDEVLELARITRSEMHPEVVNLSEQAQLISAELQRGKSERQVLVNVEKDLIAEGDRRLLRILLSNLLENALKFTAKRDHPEITFGKLQQNGESTYFIRDNGAGFEMAYVHKLFSAFQRLHSAREFEGTGIGLATVQRIVHRHGGNVWAEGAVNQGATFYFTLPGFKEVDGG